MPIMNLFSSLLAYVASACVLSTVTAKSGPTTVAYIEVNSNNLTNVGRYTLNDGSNAFDIANIFAANTKWNGTDTTLYINPAITTILGDLDNNVRPLQTKGIKVVLSILGGGEGAGVANFASEAKAAVFAAEVADVVNKYGLDGVDIDDEYAEYGCDGCADTTPQNQQSIGWFISALRSALPAPKLITFYFIGPAASYLSKSPASVGAQLNYAYNPYYDSYRAPTVPGLGKQFLSPAAVDISSTPTSDAASFASSTVAQGYGCYMTYNLGGGNHSEYVSAFTEPLYGSPATYD